MMDKLIAPFILDHAPIGVIAINGQGDITYANRAVTDLFGYNPQALIHKHIATLIPPPFDHHTITKTSRETSYDSKNIDILGLRIDGSSFPAILSMANDPINIAQHILYIRENISQARRDEFAQKYIKIDPLTGFLNHHAFENRLKREHEREQRHKRIYGIFVMNLHPMPVDHPDRHDLLTIFADYCRHFFRKSDVLGCWNHDEFIAFLPEIDTDSAQSIASRLIQSMPLPKADPAGPAQVGINIGISLSSHINDGQTYQSIITKAADNLKQANAKGLNHYIY